MNKKEFLTNEDIGEIEFLLEFYTDRRCKAIAYTGISADIAIFNDSGLDIVDFIISIIYKDGELLCLNIYEIHGYNNLSLEKKISQALRKASALL